MKLSNMEERYSNLKLAEKGARISIIAYVVLTALKLGVGYFAGSKALFADGLNNSTDILASLAVLIGLKISRKPADEEHAYGHFRAETIASLISSLIMIAVGLDVLYNAVIATIYFKAQAPDLISAYTALVCGVIIYFVYRYNKKVALKINSAGLMAAAKDNLSDAWVSVGAAVGIIASQFGLPWVDPLAAAIVGVLIIKTGRDIFVAAARNLTDGYDKSEIDKVADRLNLIEGIHHVSAVRARLHGNVTHMDIIIHVDSEMTVSNAHKLTEEAERVLRDEYSITEVIIHVEPFHS
ncbi:MAG TPA: cation diffusion facilitator family transporter [Anaerovoracaceae bacterium]|nr:cation diffusion facilitator family transporter [Anaerovoracaceae bacterium]